MIRNAKIKRSSIQLTQPPEYTHAKINPSILSNNKRLSAKLAAPRRISGLYGLVCDRGPYKCSPSTSPCPSPIPPAPSCTPPPHRMREAQGDDSSSDDEEEEDEEGNEIEMNAAATMCSHGSARSGTIWINPMYTTKDKIAPEVSCSDNPSNLSMRSSIGFSNSLALCSPLPSQTVLLPQFTKTNTNLIFGANGYADVEKICDTLQGQLLKARLTKLHKHLGVGSYVAIKQVDKELSWHKTAVQDGMTFVVSEDVIKEAVILKHLTCDCAPTGDYIVRYVDLFENASYFFLVTEWVEGMTLDAFIDKVHGFLRDGKMSPREWAKTMKYIFWKVVSIFRWLHDVCSCCHLDVTANNILLTKCEFLTDDDGMVTIGSSITIKLIDFGVAELFNVWKTDGDAFHCNKEALTIDHEIWQAPEVLNMGDFFDARAADMWQIGILFYRCMIGTHLYTPKDVVDESLGPYRALREDKLQRYLVSKGLLRKFKVASFKMLRSLLAFDPKRRLTADQCAQHAWFSSYWKKYSVGLNKKHANDLKVMEKLHEKLSIFR